MQSNIKEYYDLMLGELQDVTDNYKIVIDTNKEITKEVEAAKKFILNAAEKASSENEFIQKSSDKIEELQDKLNDLYKLAH